MAYRFSEEPLFLSYRDYVLEHFVSETSLPLTSYSVENFFVITFHDSREFLL